MGKIKIFLAIMILGSMLLFQIDKSEAAVFGITGVETTVSLTSFDTLVGLGLTPAPLGTATVDASVTPPDIVFPITGGTFNDTTSTALIEHDGSGFSLTGFGSSLFLENFVIDTETSKLTGDASFDNTSISALSIFDITTSLELLLTTESAAAIDGIFGVGDLTGTQIGIASLNVETGAPVPEPATLFLLSAGLIGVGLGRKKWKK